MISIWTETLPEGWWWTPTNYLGGTPEFVVETAKSLSRNDDVAVYYDGPSMQYGEVYYLPRTKYKPTERVLSCNERPPEMGESNVYWTNKMGQKDTDYMDFDERITLSKYHQSLFGPHSVIIGHACWPKEFISNLKEEKLCLYSSSPDRGLDFLESIWPEVEETGARLISTYDKNISESEMTELYKKAQFWLHPGQGVELFCISAYKAMAAGCIPIVVPNMALDETVKYGVKTTLANYKRDLIRAIENPPEVPTVKLDDWDDVTNKIEKLFKGK